MQIGPAGEKAVRFACIINNSNRANGRTGMGAVMGSKNLRAVVVRGKNRPSVADKSKLSELAKWGAANLEDSDIAGLSKYGTNETTGANQTSGTLPAYNFNSGVFDGWEALDGATMYDTVLKGAAEGKQYREGRDTCFACTVRCKRVVEITKGPYQVDPYYGGPEYETTSTFGNYCAIDDLPAVCKANEICNKYGMDTISCGATISWAYEAFNEGKLTLENTDGLDLTWGNAESMVKLTEKIAQREGFGDLLAEGSERAAKKIGRGTEAYLITFKGQEAPAHMPRVKRSLAVVYATNPFGADHQSHEHDPAIEEDDFEFYEDRMAVLGFSEGVEPRSLNKEKMRFTVISQRLYSAMDSLNLCQFVYGPAWQLYGPDDIVELVRSVTGWEDFTYSEIDQVGERRINMMRAFNAREGLDRKQDLIPEKLFKPLKGGASDGWKLNRDEVEKAMDNYYQISGWTKDTGIPTREKLEELDLGWVADQL
jgi:aldehyde:ferredoxin oxidoreductase